MLLAGQYGAGAQLNFTRYAQNTVTYNETCRSGRAEADPPSLWLHNAVCLHCSVNPSPVYLTCDAPALPGQQQCTWSQLQGPVGLYPYSQCTIGCLGSSGLNVPPNQLDYQIRCGWPVKSASDLGLATHCYCLCLAGTLSPTAP